MAKGTFKGGVHPPEQKELTEHLSIETMPLPSKVTIPLVQHIGAPCKPLVKPGDLVKTGQVIGEMGGFVSAPVHASISGKVLRVTDADVVSGGKAKCIIIQGDGTDTWVEGSNVSKTLADYTAQELKDKIRDAGIVGLGGAGFPAHVKLSPPEGVTIDSIILNGAECEPYLTCDHRLMLEHSEKVVQGLQALMKAVNVPQGYIAIEENKPDAIKQMKETVASIDNIKVVPLITKYPQGGEKQLIDAVLGRVVPSGKLPMHIGVIVNNIHTAYAISEAVFNNRVLVERVMTVSGRGINTPKNLLVRIGTPMQEVVEYCGGLKDDVKKIVTSAPMTGFAQYTTDFPTEKRIGGLVALCEDEVDLTPESACIRCGRCADVCPIHLIPSKIDKLSRLGRYDEAEKHHAMDCIECAACTFICPAKRSLIQSIKLAKNEIRAKRRR